MLVFCAVIVRAQTNLLPSNKNTLTQIRLSERYDKTYIISDTNIALATGIERVDLQGLTLSILEDSDNGDFSVPQIALSHIAAICFTSGSTGDAKAILKSWCTFVQSTKINCGYMVPNQEQTFYHLATVPSQHMWGLETTVLMALLSPVCMVDAQPFYPQDICTQLAILPSPTTLVTTPLHLRALNSINDTNLELDNVLVATAPINQELSHAIETKFNTQVREVYGCSEVGSMAIRQPARTQLWHQFAGLDYIYKSDGSVIVTGDHLSEDIIIDDQLTSKGNDLFTLSGRNTDQIKIAGKRGSLTEVNNVLMKFSSLIDGVVIFPTQERVVPRLVALVVLPEEHHKNELRQHFSQHLDAVFIPRPIIIVDALPREENGKLIKSKVTELYHSLIAS